MQIGEMEGYLRNLYVQAFQRKAQKMQTGMPTDYEDGQIDLLREIIDKLMKG